MCYRPMTLLTSLCSYQVCVHKCVPGSAKQGEMKSTRWVSKWEKESTVGV